MFSRVGLCLFVSMFLTVTAHARDDSTKPQSKAAAAPKTVHDFEVTTIDGEKVKLDKYKDKVLLIVNVASKCGLTDTNYKGLEPLYRKYKERGLRILAFPANDFLQQEPGTNADIKRFCRTKYDVTFDLFAKVCVKGDDICPLYAFLTKYPDPKVAGPVAWNFQKYLIDADGKPIEMFSPRTAPDDEKLIKAIEDALKAVPQEPAAEDATTNGQ